MSAASEGGVALNLAIGQRVRHRDFKGQRVTGTVIALSVEDRALMVDIALDQALVIPPRGEFSETRIYRQHVPAHELSAFDDRDELIAEMLAALRRANGFITNGIALGFIRMPDADTADTAHQTPGIVRAAIAKATGAAA